ncbi:MAG: hypothetical protein ACFB2W_00925 [Leptolyngbyaceae cyanobacterium]
MKTFSDPTEEVMRRYGLWGLTSLEDSVKGTLYDPDDSEVYGTYLDAEDLRELAAACIEVADHLDAVAQAKTERLQEATHASS